MMKEITLVFDKNNCMGCHACEIACKQEHGLDVGPRLIQVIEKSPYFIPIYCRHCVEASCEEVCPEEAISRNKQGIVLINNELCIGCKKCIEACPFGAMQFNDIKGIAVKCDLCVERILDNKQPSCVSVCPTKCIYLDSVKTA